MGEYGQLINKICLIDEFSARCSKAPHNHAQYGDATWAGLSYGKCLMFWKSMKEEEAAAGYGYPTECRGGRDDCTYTPTTHIDTIYYTTIPIDFLI